uniref:hypothetical protein n=1 Tax=Ascoseira mirabilis TaxID=76830 RepID=UPI0030011925|nr:hypothetical protein ASMI079 [Ascoseira mirabilis]
MNKLVPSQPTNVVLTNKVFTEISNQQDDFSKLHIEIDDFPEELQHKDPTINELYKKYNQYTGYNADDLPTREKLNRIKIYFLAKSRMKTVDSGKTLKRITVPIPINNMDDLSNCQYGKSIITRMAYFQMRSPRDVADTTFRESRKGNRPFLLQHVMVTTPPYLGISEFPLEELVFPLEAPMLMHIDDKEIFWEMEYKPPELRYETVMFDGEMKEMPYYVGEFEYDYNFADNGAVSLTLNYSVEPRNPENLKRTIMDRLKSFKDIIKTIDRERIKKIRKGDDIQFYNFISNVVNYVNNFDFYNAQFSFENTEQFASKNIIPIFSTLEEAQELHTIIVEEILEPYKNARWLENESNIDFFPDDCVDYLEDSFTSQNRYQIPRTEEEQIIEELVKEGELRGTTNISRSNLYKKQHWDQDADDLDKKDLNQYNGNLNFPDGYPCSLLSESDITDTEFLIIYRGVKSTKIVSMGLGDFLSFWNNKTTKNAEALFIPSSRKLNKINIPILPKKPRDRFFDYQQKFQANTKYTKYNTTDYSYEIQN